jgi:UDP-N-acetylglucosamine--N-acetylmuramyl-(pentapeptide) pyrophosphoryl-undecaprenol N-acetylglucosamine transferase
MRILLTGGGTGGHITPLIAVARETKKICQENGFEIPEFFFMGPAGFSEELLAKENIPVKIILAGKIRRYFSFKNFLDIFKAPAGLLQAIFKIFFLMPDVVFSKGGYGSVPVVLASRLFRIPVLLHESDAVPGLANRFLSKYSQKIATSFATAEKFFPNQKIAVTGNPVRDTITKSSPESAQKIFGLPGEKQVLFIFCGSQGAKPINDLIISAITDLLEKYELIWQAGIENYGLAAKQIKEIFNEIPRTCHLAAFLNEEQIAAAFAASTLVVSRAGASNIFEIAACAKPSILIPLPNSASDHQRENAFEYAKYGAATVMEQTNLTPHVFAGEISRLINNKELLQKMSDCAKSFAKPGAARKIAIELLALAEKVIQ